VNEAGFLRQVREHLDVDDQGAQVVTAAVLVVLRSRLTAKQVAHLDAQLPIRLKRWRPLGSVEPKAVRFRKAEFFRRVSLLAGLPRDDAQRATRAVFKALQAALESPTGYEGEGWGIFSQLPKDLKRVWSEASRRSGPATSFKEVDMKIEQVMSREVVVCAEHDSLHRAAELMWENDCGCLPVIAVNGDGTLAGMITDRDIAMAAYIQGKPLTAIQVSDVFSRNVIVCHAEDDVKQAEVLMRDHQVRRLPVVDAKHKVVGIVSLNDLVRQAVRSHEQPALSAVVETISSVSRPRHLTTIPATHI